MQTLQIEIQDDLYNTIKENSIDINNKVKDFLYSLVDDGYPSINTDDAKQRVSKAVENYKNNNTSYCKYDENLKNEMNNYIKSL